MPDFHNLTVDMAQFDIAENDRVSETPGTSVSIEWQLSGLENAPPVTVHSASESTLVDVISLLSNALDIGNEQWFQYSGQLPTAKIPNSFEITISKEKDLIDFNKNEFRMCLDSTFAEYWDNFLETGTNLSSDYEDAGVTLNLGGESLQIANVSVEFNRTLRIPDDGKDYPLPPGLGRFEMVKVQDYIESEGLPISWRKRKGVILPMWQKEVCLCCFLLVIFFFFTFHNV